MKKGIDPNKKLSSTKVRGVNSRGNVRSSGATNTCVAAKPTRGGITTIRGGSTTARGGSTTTRGGSITTRGGSTTTRGGSTTARGSRDISKRNSTNQCVAKPAKPETKKEPVEAIKPHVVQDTGPTNKVSFEPRLGL